MLLLFSDPLIAGRFVSVLSAIITSIGLYFLGRKLFGEKVGIITVLLYIVLPFALVYDRLALMDSLVSSFAVWSLYLAVHLAEKPRLDISLLLGIAAGLGMLTKSNALFALILLPVSLLVFRWKEKQVGKRLLKWASGILLSIFIAQCMYQLLRLSPWFYIIEQKNHVFILSFGEFFNNPFNYFIHNLEGMVGMLTQYVTPPILIVILGGMIYGIYRRNPKIVLLILWFFVPFLVLAGFGKIIFPRFMLFMVMPLLIIGGYLTGEAVKFAYSINKWLLAVLLLFFLYPVIVSTTLIVNPADAAIPHVDRNQLFDDWPSGYGVKDVISFLQNKAQEGKIVVGTEGTFGLNPTVYEIYMGTNPNVEIHGYWPVNEVPEELLEASKYYPTFLIFKEKQDIPSQWPLKLIASYRRGKGTTHLLFYQVVPAKLVQ